MAAPNKVKQPLRTVAFVPTDQRTWPEALTIEQVAAIYQRSVLTIRHKCKPSAKVPFHPAPYKRRPLRWRKSDVQRDVRPITVAA